ncbi:MAG: LPXTG cell wall anchor domain-containing protein, partial [Oscillospiraceae bacterium]|nr:LPXTG cell wall anchor domain-containing protein [Oscillospiraceae bacterium]
APVETPTETENQIVVDDLAQVPEGLQSLYSTVDDLKAALFARVSISDPTYTEDNVAYYDVKLQIWNGETGQWEDATEEDFPAEGITVTLPYPTGTDSTYDFVVAHMFTVSSQRLGITAGDTELPAVTKTDDGLVVTLTGLSPVAVAWKEAEAEATPAPTATATPAATTTPNTGDGNTPLLWLAILALCGVGLGIVTGKRKRVR